jgi:hypothetical protein
MIALSSDTQLAYLALALVVVNIVMIIWQSHRVNLVNREIFLMKYAYVILSRSIAAIEEKDVSTEQAVMEMHSIAKEVAELKDRIESLSA